MCKWGCYLYICLTGCQYGKDKLPEHSITVCISQPCDFAKSWASSNGVTLPYLRVGLVHRYSCPPDPDNMDPSLDLVKERFCPTCRREIDQAGLEDDGSDKESIEL